MLARVSIYENLPMLLVELKTDTVILDSCYQFLINFNVYLPYDLAISATAGIKTYFLRKLASERDKSDDHSGPALRTRHLWSINAMACYSGTGSITFATWRDMRESQSHYGK